MSWEAPQVRVSGYVSSSLTDQKDKRVRHKQGSQGAWISS